MRGLLNHQFIKAVLVFVFLTSHPALADREHSLIVFSTDQSQFMASASDVKSINSIVIGVGGAGPLSFCFTDIARNKFAEFLKENNGTQARVQFYGVPDGNTKLPLMPGKGCYVFGHFTFDQSNHIIRVFRGEEAPKSTENAAVIPPSGYCPSEDFVQICLDGTREPKELESWAYTNGWNFQKTVTSPISTVYLFAKNGHDPFFATILTFDNSAVIECRNTSLPDISEDALFSNVAPAEITYCNAETAQLPNAVSQTPRRTPYDPKFVDESGDIFEWILSDGNFRDYILTTSKTPGATNTYWLKRIVIGAPN